MANDSPNDRRSERPAGTTTTDLVTRGAARRLLGSGRRQIGVRLGLAVGLLALSLALVAGGESFRARGPLNTGHEELACGDCHLAASGTLRQQLQANARYLVGMREAAVEVGTRDVSAQRCLACHDRPNDRHPIYRFMEPRFAPVRATLGPHDCNSCHREHQGARVTSGNTFCQECHADLVLERDPLDVSHQQLAATASWETCLGCHDFHGNHALPVPTLLAERVPAEDVVAYLAGESSPYPLPVLFPARTPADLQTAANGVEPAPNTRGATR
jgi:hypothetical protein